MKIKEYFRKYKAIYSITGLCLTAVIGTVLIFNFSNRKNIDFITQYTVGKARNEFKTLEENYRNLLSATIEALISNKEISALFEGRERGKLYMKTYALFQHLKSENGITHWYFINPEPDKTCFLRVHAHQKHSDVITRVTLDECIKDKKKGGFGKELGKTAYALRLVQPHYFNDRLIGYMELGVELEDFFKQMKGRTGNEYGLLVLKEFLDKDKWQSVMAMKKKRNNWDDMDKMLLLSNTSRDNSLSEFNCDIKKIPDEGMVLQKIKQDNKVFVRGIFPFYDAAQRKVGGVFILKDITPIFAGMQAQKRQVTAAIIFFSTLLTLAMIFFHTRAEKELRKYRFHLEDMIRERTAELEKINRDLNREIGEHKASQEALKHEWNARIEAEKKQGAAVKLVEHSARLASIGVMAAGITHEINQPLNAIKVTADSIRYWHKRHPGALPDMFTEQLSNISKSVDRIVEIVQHMRTFWVIPDNAEVSAVDLDQAVKRSLSLLDRQLINHGIAYEFTPQQERLFIKSNPVHLEQIVANLTANAMHSVDEAGRTAKKIKISTKKDNGFAVLTVEDNGAGLPVDRIEDLFDPFFSTRKAGEGMGLGLAIVKNYIDRCKGQINAANNRGGGATFTVWFPLCDREAVESSGP
ncbi:MAG: GHKL domain-containing protein [Candidatus Aminicenantes bacterium]|nr:GHKL domain-containing protein [Candidatus Aminicenantes bacterium]